MAVKIKLKRLGKIREPYYRIVVADARTKRDGRAIEEIGKYQPKNDPSIIDVDSERVQYWLSVGAQPTESVQKLLQVTGDWQKFKGLPGAEGTLKVAEPKADKKERYEELAKASLTAKEEAKAASRSARGPKKETAKDSAKDSAKSAKDSAKKDAAAEATDEAAVAAVASQEPAKAEAPADGGSEA